MPIRRRRYESGHHQAVHVRRSSEAHACHGLLPPAHHSQS